MYKRVRVCTQVPDLPIAVNTAALGFNALLSEDSELEEKSDAVDNAARCSTNLRPEDWDLLDNAERKGLKWMPAINKTTKAKKSVKKPAKNQKQATRAHKNNLLLSQINSYAASY